MPVARRAHSAPPIEDVATRFRELAPDGVDVSYDNVGGSILDTALLQIRERGWVVICGAISRDERMDQAAGSVELPEAGRASRTH